MRETSDEKEVIVHTPKISHITKIEKYAQGLKKKCFEIEKRKRDERFVIA